jgi:hypothetical protein
VYTITCHKFQLSSFHTSSGSTSLNSIPLPVHMMHDALFGSSSNVTRNCHNCNAPRRWGCGGTVLPAYPSPLLISCPEDATDDSETPPPVWQRWQHRWFNIINATVIMRKTFSRVVFVFNVQSIPNFLKVINKFCFKLSKLYVKPKYFYRYFTEKKTWHFLILLNSY